MLKPTNDKSALFVDYLACFRNVLKMVWQRDVKCVHSWGKTVGFAIFCNETGSQVNVVMLRKLKADFSR